MRDDQELLIQSVVLLNRQYLLIENLIKTHTIALSEFESAVSLGKQKINHVLDVYNYVFALIDNLVRYQKIAYSIPRLSYRSQQYREFSLAIGNLKKIRNQHQHINNDIRNEYSGPLLGSIAWVSNSKQYIAGLQDIGRQRFMPGIAFDTHKNIFVSEFCYIYNEDYYDLQKAVCGVRVFNDYIQSVVKINFDNRDFDIKERFIAYCAEFRLNDK